MMPPCLLTQSSYIKIPRRTGSAARAKVPDVEMVKPILMSCWAVAGSARADRRTRERAPNSTVTLLEIMVIALPPAPHPRRRSPSPSACYTETSPGVDQRRSGRGPDIGLDLHTLGQRVEGGVVVDHAED